MFYKLVFNLILIIIFFFSSFCSSMQKTNEDELPPSAEIEKEEGASGISDGESINPKKSSEKKGYKSDEDSESSTSSGEYSPNNSSSGLKAGYADDNKQFNYFINFLEKYKFAKHLPLNVSERIIINVKDSSKKFLANANVKIYKTKTPNLKFISNDSQSHIIEEGVTYSDGTYLFFPSEHSGNNFSAVVSKNGKSQTVSFTRNGARNIEVS
ncbi:MAG: hypothetical protein KDK36_12020, partial [Leptospiraceae bacterium]|nr:hypothetical protein [Leptospiraceae bacterium]